ncbi:MAG TPA: trypsin-like peptidase domain-containing protein [Pseudonocardia sp.]
MTAPAARKPLTLVTVAVLAVAACAGPAADQGSVAPPPPATAVSHPSDVRWPATGALFDRPPDQLGEHYCTASVIHTSTGDTVMTAAHCVAEGDGTPARTGMSFVPGYHDHADPFGVWTVTAAAVDDAWRDHADPDHDIAFLTVARDGAPPIEQIVGGYHLVLDPGSSTTVDALGYPDSADAPTIRSGVTARFSPTQLELDAPGLADGTSGGPWLRIDPAAGNTADVIAVTGGSDEGGIDPDTSYATYLGDAAAALFHQVGGTP